MGETEPSRDRTAVDPEEAFRLLGHDIRVQILLALWRAADHALGFSELYDAVDVDDSGQFTYHLSKLEGRFVRHADETYELLYAGHRVIDAIRSGVFHERLDIDPTELETDCIECGTTLAFVYSDHVARVSCPDCERVWLEYPFDPGGVVERSIEDVATAFDRRTRYVWGLAGDGVCPVCAGDVRSRFLTDVPQADHYAADHPVTVHLDCRRCSFFSYVPVGGVILDRPAVVSFFFERERPLRETPIWTHPFVVDPGRVERRSTDPWRVRVTVTAGDDAIRLTLVDPGTVESIDAVET